MDPILLIVMVTAYIVAQMAHVVVQSWRESDETFPLAFIAASIPALLALVLAIVLGTQLADTVREGQQLLEQVQELLREGAQ